MPAGMFPQLQNFNAGHRSFTQLLTLSSTSVLNPFTKRESYPAQSVLTYKILTILSWLVMVIPTIYYTFNAPHDDNKHWRDTIWGHNISTPFAMNSVITSIYWYVLASPELEASR